MTTRETFVGNRPPDWPADDQATFIPWPDWATAHFMAEPQPCRLDRFLSLAVENRIPRAVIVHLLGKHQLPLEWCPKDMAPEDID